MSRMRIEAHVVSPHEDFTDSARNQRYQQTNYLSSTTRNHANRISDPTRKSQPGIKSRITPKPA
jgi:hypothetical protein